LALSLIHALLKMAEFSKDFFKAAFTVDNVIFGFDDSDLKVLLINRGTEPYNNMWALPGDFIFPNEGLDAAANRVLEELTSIKRLYLEQVRTFGAVNRHPLGRVITVAYFSLVKIDRINLAASSFAQQVKWVPISEVRALAFDHNEILDACFYALKQRVRVRPVGFELLPPKFTLTELQHLYEAILEAELDKRNFRKKILSMDFIVDLQESQEGVAHRPARLYEFNKEKYERFVSEGFNFEV
jgi:8-oxo-dGTP diphosphatase